MVMISAAGNIPDFHITKTSRKREASGKANSESDVSSNQRRQLRGSFVGETCRGTAERHHPVCGEGSTSGLPHLSVLPGWMQGLRGAMHHSLGLPSLSALCFPLN